MSTAAETHIIVKGILDEIEAGGDAKALEYAAKFDLYQSDVLLSQGESMRPVRWFRTS